MTPLLILALPGVFLLLQGLSNERIAESLARAGLVRNGKGVRQPRTGGLGILRRIKYSEVLDG
jgi:hypothetical protein